MLGFGGWLGCAPMTRRCYRYRRALHTAPDV